MAGNLTQKEYLKELVDDLIDAAVEYGQANDHEEEAAERNLNNASEILYSAIEKLVDN